MRVCLYTHNLLSFFVLLIFVELSLYVTWEKERYQISSGDEDRVLRCTDENKFRNQAVKYLSDNSSEQASV